jgi:hypothetical protein
MIIATLKYSGKTTRFNMSDTADNSGAQHVGASSRVLPRWLNFAVCFRAVSLFFCLFLFALATQPVLANRIQVENAKAGNPEWRIDDQNIAKNKEIEGYTFPASVNSNNTINFYVNSTIDQTYTLTIYRLGWYNGAGARRMQPPITRTSIKQVLPTPNSTTGLVEANWRNPYRLTIPSNWVSGIYIVLVKGDQSGLNRYIPFVVTNDGRFSNYLFQSAVTTWQAYNAWGGKSLYSSNSTGGAARKVSFNRPYQRGAGMGDLGSWEIYMLRFLEREGYDVSYQADTDTHESSGSQLYLYHKALLSVGHDEYWTKKMRDNVENARNHGLGLGFFGANAAYWQNRLEPSGIGQRNRTIVSYKDFAATEDPYALDLDSSNDILITTRWRESPVNRPENMLIGIMYTTDPVDGDIVVSDASHWVYTGTGLRNGDKLAGLLGYEIDSYVNNGQAPANTQIIATSPDPLNSATIGNMTVYTRGCPSSYRYFCANITATVFATGSMQWNWGLDNYGYRGLENNAAKQITRNVLARLISGSLPASLP